VASEKENGCQMGILIGGFPELVFSGQFNSKLGINFSIRGINSFLYY
jgi:hypothetical protein